MKRRIGALLCAALLMAAGAFAELPEPEFTDTDMVMGEIADRYFIDASIFYASADGNNLEEVRRTIPVTPGESLALRLIEELITPPGTRGLMSVVPGDTRISGVEECDGFVSVDLSADAAALQEYEDRALLFSALCSTLTAVDGIDAVSVMINSVQEDVCGVPVGVMTTSDISVPVTMARYEDERGRMGNDGVIKTAAVYFPAGNGLFMVPELMEVEIKDDNCAQAILNALENGTGRGGLCLNMATPATGMAPLAGEAYVNDAGLRIIDIEISQGYMDELALRGVGQWQMAAAFTLSMCSFVPGLDGVRVLMDGDILTDVSVKGTSRTFEDGVMRRADFETCIGSIPHIYLPGEGGLLKKMDRITSPRRAFSPHSALLQLIAGPTETEEDVLPCMPEGTGAGDLLGVEISGGTAAVNFSANFYRLCQNLDEEGERLLVYSIVNTLCLMHGVGDVQILIEGEKTETLSNNIYLGAPLMANYGIIEE